MLPAAPDGGSRASMRASDADRDRCVAVLRDHCGQGRISLLEFEQRVDVAFSARTLAELDEVVRDLPVPVAVSNAVSAVSSRHDPPRPGRARRAGRVLVAILSESTRRGRFQAPDSMTAVALLGECVVDLSQATFTDNHLVVTAVAALGAVTVIVPDGVHADVTGLAILGEKSSQVDDLDVPAGATVVVVRAVALLGEVQVRSLSKQERVKREQRARAS